MIQRLACNVPHEEAYGNRGPSKTHALVGKPSPLLTFYTDVEGVFKWCLTPTFGEMKGSCLTLAKKPIHKNVLLIRISSLRA